MQQKQVFCSRCQTVTIHNVSVDANGEFLFECQNLLQSVEGQEQSKCLRFFKLPADTTDFSGLLTAHQVVNVGQVSLEEQEAKLASAMAALPDEIIVAQPSPVEEVAIESEVMVEEAVDVGVPMPEVVEQSESEQPVQ